ncbi:hypothetical protein PIB30_082627, partial [Stylosanthes scabra]|nr:hypothetical protein [Stylosanthes scabra]
KHEPLKTTKREPHLNLELPKRDTTFTQHPTPQQGITFGVLFHNTKRDYHLQNVTYVTFPSIKPKPSQPSPPSKRDFLLTPFTQNSRLELPPQTETRTNLLILEEFEDKTGDNMAGNQDMVGSASKASCKDVSNHFFDPP